MAKRPDAPREITVKKSKPGGKTADSRARAQKKARSKAEKELTEAQEALAAAQVKIKQERRARIRVEKELAKAQEAVAIPGEYREPRPPAQTLPAVPGDGQPQSRDFFVVRLEFERPGQPGWMEIEHGLSRTKRMFRDLDGEVLVAFIKECINPAPIPEHVLSEMPPANQTVIPMPESLTLTSGLIVSEVRIARLETPEVASLMLNSGEAFGVQIHFYLQGPEALSTAAQEPPYEINVYAHSMLSGKPQLLTTYHARLAREVVDYPTQIQVPGLSPGLYRLYTLAILRTTIRKASFYDGPLIQVI